MKYEQAKHLKPGEFKRFWGVKLETLINSVVIDVTESPIERPKKNKSSSIVARKKGIPLSLKL